MNQANNVRISTKVKGLTLRIGNAGGNHSRRMLSFSYGGCVIKYVVDGKHCERVSTVPETGMPYTMDRYVDKVAKLYVKKFQEEDMEHSKKLEQERLEREKALKEQQKSGKRRGVVSHYDYDLEDVDFPDDIPWEKFYGVKI